MFIQTQIKENIGVTRRWPLCGEFTGMGEFPAQRASYAENVSIWLRHHTMNTDYINKCDFITIALTFSSSSGLSNVSPLARWYVTSLRPGGAALGVAGLPSAGAAGALKRIKALWPGDVKVSEWESERVMKSEVEWVRWSEVEWVRWSE